MDVHCENPARNYKINYRNTYPKYIQLIKSELFTIYLKSMFSFVLFFKLVLFFTFNI